MGQFAVGFPIDGALSREGVFAPSRPSNTAMEPGKQFDTAAERFRERSAKSGRENATPLWGDAIGKVEKGWMFPPVALDSGGFPEGFKPDGYNVAFRFGVEQAAKLRACDDLKHSLANSACTILTPLQLVSRGHLSQLRWKCYQTGRDWSMFKAERETAYKQLPHQPAGPGQGGDRPSRSEGGIVVRIRPPYLGIRGDGGRPSLQCVSPADNRPGEQASRDPAHLLFR